MKSRPDKQPPPRPRHRAGTERTLIEAVGATLADGGVSALGLSAVARRAGVDKALIYRYFGSFEQLLDAYIKDAIYWPTPDDVAGDRGALMAMPFAQRFATVMKRYAAAIRARPDTIAILAAELAAGATPFQAALEGRREQFGLALLALAHDAPAGLDVPALATVVTGSIHYLLIRARQVALFNGIAIATDEGWSRIEAAIDRTVRGAVLAP